MADDPNIFPPAQEPEERNWVPIVVGLVGVLAVVVGIALLTRSRVETVATPNPYAASLKMSELRMSQSDNFAGTTVTYLDFRLTNAGNQTLIGASAEALFKDDLGQVVQKELLPVKVLKPSAVGSADDVYDLSVSPLGPGETKTVRLTLDRVASGWNQAVPELRFVNLKMK
jgi:preprotein translocase subunit SecY